MSHLRNSSISKPPSHSNSISFEEQPTVLQISPPPEPLTEQLQEYMQDRHEAATQRQVRNKRWVQSKLLLMSRDISKFTSSIQKRQLLNSSIYEYSDQPEDSEKTEFAAIFDSVKYDQPFALKPPTVRHRNLFSFSRPDDILIQDHSEKPAFFKTNEQSVHQDQSDNQSSISDSLALSQLSEMSDEEEQNRLAILNSSIMREKGQMAQDAQYSDNSSYNPLLDDNSSEQKDTPRSDEEFAEGELMFTQNPHKMLAEVRVKTRKSWREWFCPCFCKKNQMQYSNQGQKISQLQI